MKFVGASLFIGEESRVSFDFLRPLNCIDLPRFPLKLKRAKVSQRLAIWPPHAKYRHLDKKSGTKCPSGREIKILFNIRGGEAVTKRWRSFMFIRTGIPVYNIKYYDMQ